MMNNEKNNNNVKSKQLYNDLQTQYSRSVSSFFDNNSTK